MHLPYSSCVVIYMMLDRTQQDGSINPGAFSINSEDRSLIPLVRVALNLSSSPARGTSSNEPGLVIVWLRAARSPKVCLLYSR